MLLAGGRLDVAQLDQELRGIVAPRADQFDDTSRLRSVEHIVVRRAGAGERLRQQ